MPLSLASFLIVLVALAGAIAFYVQYDNSKKLQARSAQAMVDQQNKTLKVFDQIEANLAKIREHESMIQQDFKGPENSGDLSPEERIQNEITYIQYLMDENNKLISSLNGQIGEKDKRIASYEKSVKDLKSRLGSYQNQLELLAAEKDSLMNDLDASRIQNSQLASTVNDLNDTVALKSDLIAQQLQQLIDKDRAYYSAYYTVGTFKSLRDRDVLEKEGGFLGINRITTLVDNPDTKQFQKIDTREINKIPIFSKHFEMVTDRDTTSYEVQYADEMAEWLLIKDPQKFWDKSRYLVVVVRDDGSNELAQSR